MMDSLFPVPAPGGDSNPDYTPARKHQYPRFDCIELGRRIRHWGYLPLCSVGRTLLSAAFDVDVGLPLRMG